MGITKTSFMAIISLKYFIQHAGWRKEDSFCTHIWKQLSIESKKLQVSYPCLELLNRCINKGAFPFLVYVIAIMLQWCRTKRIPERLRCKHNCLLYERIFAVFQRCETDWCKLMLDFQLRALLVYFCRLIQKLDNSYHYLDNFMTVCWFGCH